MKTIYTISRKTCQNFWLYIMNLYTSKNLHRHIHSSQNNTRPAAQQSSTTTRTRGTEISTGKKAESKRNCGLSSTSVDCEKYESYWPKSQTSCRPVVVVCLYVCSFHSFSSIQQRKIARNLFAKVKKFMLLYLYRSIDVVPFFLFYAIFHAT